MRIEKTQIFGFASSIRAMRNPMDSWNSSDSSIRDFPIKGISNNNIEGFILGKKDKKLSQNLSKAGTDHRKHLRLIRAWADFTLPRYVWTETDTYECLLAIYNSRKNHPLPQWKEICKWILELPYFIELTGIEV